MKKRHDKSILREQKIGGSKSSDSSLAPHIDRLATIIALAIVLVIISAAGIVVVTAGNKAYDYVLSEKYLVVENIEIKGIKVLAEDELIKISGIRKNQPILNLNLQNIASKINAHPRVASAVVERHLPRTIVINVEERIPVGLIQIDGELKGIDASGIVIPLLPSREKIIAPIINGYNKDVISDDMLKEAISVIQLMRPDIVTQISEIKLDPSIGITLLSTGSSMVIRLGRGDAENKIERLRKVLKLFEERGEKKEYIDLRFKDIITRP